MAIALMAVMAIRLVRTRHSWFELERRGDTHVMRRETLLSDILAFRRFAVVVCIIVLSALSVILWGWWGIFATGVAVLLCVHLGRAAFIYKRVNTFYKKHEPKLLDTAERFSIVGTLLGAERVLPADQRLESTEQLLHLVESAGHILTTDQQNIISRGLVWHSITVDSVMTPHEHIVSIRHSELLGPLVLHDLHESGHTVFPVIKKDLDHVIGTVDIAEFLQVDKTKSSHTAEKVMVPNVLTVAEDTLLPEALQLLVSSRQPFLIVATADGTTTGLVTLRDVLDALLGKNRGEVVK